MDYEATIEKIKRKINSLGKCPIHNCPAHYCNTDDNFSQKNQANSNPKKRYAEPTIKSSKMRINQDYSFQRPNKRHTANGIKNRKIELQDFINNHSPDLLLIQESHLQKRDKFYLPNFEFFRNDRDNPLLQDCGRHLPYHHIPTPPLQHIEATVISLNLPNLDPIIIASIYVPLHLILICSH
ncbi:RNA-directed DNA polymerase from mobile element jockey [Caerostris extrusa]|uniref:RNA-directed DNA polymerase from mobile element jockey n=1 Tax=Caerostris extrusa TaxID=172846 RepID=A0AAV4RZQ7_CAEEX|nr:RNA-directed DNA polymerase from mobile element jockey [Caerostris extrusa]